MWRRTQILQMRMTLLLGRPGILHREAASVGGLALSHRLQVAEHLRGRARAAHTGGHQTVQHCR